jgi:hypothetical protein
VDSCSKLEVHGIIGFLAVESDKLVKVMFGDVLV